LKHLDLFSGIGGFALAARNVGWQTVGFCESEPFCQSVLRKHWPDVPIHDDVRTLTSDAVGSVDIITGGYPCQPFSLAGERRGQDDDRHLWPHFARLIRELRPRWVLGENVAGHVTLGLDDVLADLEGLGYSWEAFVIPAAAVDARHRRDRVWIAANASGDELRNESGRSSGPSRADTAEPRDDGAQEPVANCHVSRLAQREGERSDPRTKLQAAERASRWLPEPGVGRVADGIPGRVDRLRALGNAIVPQVAEEIFRAIDAVNKERM
jgi:DNA (cytosine-5)-methyltransferase 1